MKKVTGYNLVVGQVSDVEEFNSKCQTLIDQGYQPIANIDILGDFHILQLFKKYGAEI